MKMSSTPDTVIITISYIIKKISVDVELPAVLPVKVLRGKILDVMKSVYGGIFSQWSSCILISGNRVLHDDETLSDVGIYDGGYIYVDER